MVREEVFLPVDHYVIGNVNAQRPTIYLKSKSDSPVGSFLSIFPPQTSHMASASGYILSSFTGSPFLSLIFVVVVFSFAADK